MAAGAATASVIAEICVTLVQFIAVRKQISAGRVLKIILRYILLSIPMFVVGVVDSRSCAGRSAEISFW